MSRRDQVIALLAEVDLPLDDDEIGGRLAIDSAIVKIVLGGGSNAEDLADIARLVGERTEREYSETSQSGGGRSVSAANRERAILEPSAIRSISPGHALLLLRSARPIMLTLRPWTARADAPRLERDRALVEEAIRVAAEKWPGGP